eukprot:gene3300-4085_t
MALKCTLLGDESGHRWAPGASSTSSTISSPGEPPSHGLGDHTSLGTLLAYLEDMLPLDVRREPLTDETIRNAVELWRNNPVLAVERIKHKSEGHHTWSEAEINRFFEAYPLGTMAHLCMCIMLYTGVRVSDAAVMGRQHVHKGHLSFRAQKNKVVVDMPVSPELQAAIDAVRVSRK